MSRTVDAQRALQAEEARIARAIKVLEELLRLVKLRQERLPLGAIATRIDRGRATVYRREQTLRQLLALVGTKGQRHSQ